MTRAGGLADGMLWLCGFGILGLGLELALTRHWQSWIQGIAWLALALLAWAWWLLHRHRMDRGADGARARLRATRLAMLVAAGGLVGIVMHVWGNYDAAPLDAVYGKIWEATPLWKQWWLAFSMRVVCCRWQTTQPRVALPFAIHPRSTAGSPPTRVARDGSPPTRDHGFRGGTVVIPITAWSGTIR